MSMIAYVVNDFLSDIQGYDLISQIRWSFNGDWFGYNEIAVGTSYENESGDHVIWDDNIDDGIDTGWRPIQIEFGEGPEGMSIDLDGIVATQAVEYVDGIDYVHIRSAVHSKASMQWSSVTLYFYHDNILTEEIEVSDVGVDTTDTLWGATEEQIVSIYPSESDNDRVVIVGAVRMVAPEGVLPDAFDIISDVRVYA